MSGGDRNRILNRIEKILNRFNLREKIIGLFLVCVVIPLILFDIVIINRMVAEERAEEEYNSKKMTETVENYFAGILKDCQGISASISQNYKIGEALGTVYESGYDYYDKYHQMSENNYFQTLVRYDSTAVKLYTSNDTVVGGGYVGRIDSVEDTTWYKSFRENDAPYTFVCGYDDARGSTESKRRVYYIANLKYKNNDYENFIRIDVDYGSVSRGLENMGFNRTIYVCDGDTILFSNRGNNSKGIPFEEEMIHDNAEYCSYPTNLGNINRIVVLNEDKNIYHYLYDNRYLLIIVLAVSILLPMLLLRIIDFSIVHRIEKLNNVFGKQVNDELVPVENPDGSDEIGNLMVNYNRMVEEVNQLIQIVYKDKLREQEANIARKNAELLALHSQINPHFMFNALESIRMHSVIKGEDETAEMVEKLALMERQYVDWGSDMIQVSQEMSSVEAYLLLQKYRFGDKLMYELDVDEECASRLVPKLTIVTFVENACVHGMENKTMECWVFVRVYTEGNDMVIEVEDTGTGIDENQVAKIVEKSKTIEIDDVKNAGHVGILNALLRLKMTMGDNYEFDIESEEGIGTIIQIRIPIRQGKEEA